jgi:hypothetical protein
LTPPLTPEQSYLKDWKESNRFGYLLSGEVFVSHAQEVAALETIPFPVPYVTGFNKFGSIEIKFNHRVQEH